ncbi:hypothetical protein MKZ38_005497 [Zalerion maritima]|uniref:Zn(2)-C6 fungal-type domain-containing protein n=1 Tax=Zalerion maritima TaxID=339359 RepID=A0AAD5S3V8_9PEZI|nr:hypothetical protein MKZ38_005497 [Zalerion maritima]
MISTQEGGSSTKRLACDRCHSQKLRCERNPRASGDDPCQRCARAKAQCRYGPPLRIGRPSTKRRHSQTESPTQAPSPAVTNQTDGPEPGSSSASSTRETAFVPNAVGGTPQFFGTELDFDQLLCPLDTVNVTGDNPLDTDMYTTIPGNQSSVPAPTIAESQIHSPFVHHASLTKQQDTDVHGASVAPEATLVPQPASYEFLRDTVQQHHASESHHMLGPSPPPLPEASSTTGLKPMTKSLGTAPDGNTHAQTGDPLYGLTQLQLELYQLSSLRLASEWHHSSEIIEGTIRLCKSFSDILSTIHANSNSDYTKRQGMGPVTPDSWSIQELLTPWPSPPNSAPARPAAKIDMSSIMLVLTCYMKLLEGCKEVVLLLRRLLSSDSHISGSCHELSAEQEIPLPQIHIGCFHSPTSPRLRAKLLTQLVEHMIDEMRSRIRQVVLAGSKTEGCGPGGGGGGGHPLPSTRCGSAEKASRLMQMIEEMVGPEERNVRQSLTATMQALRSTSYD